MNDDHAIEARPDCAAMRGVMRLDSPDAYARLFEPMRKLMIAAPHYAIDVTELVLMNSSGIRALGMLVLAAKRAGIKVTLRGKRDVPWQKKTMASLAPLYPTGLTVELA